MASSNASIHASSHNLSHEHIAPLESVVTGEHSGSCDDAAGIFVNSERFPRHRSPYAFQPTLTNRQYAEHEADSQRIVLKRLKAWHQWDNDRYKSLRKFLISQAGFLKRPICPTPGQLFSLATYFFPPRWSLRVIVCDFGEGRFERCEVDLQNVTQCK